MQNNFDSVELIPNSPNIPLIFRVNRVLGYSFLIIPDQDILSMPVDRNKFNKIAEWGTLVATDLNLPVKFWPSMDGLSIEWSSEQGSIPINFAGIGQN